MAVSISQTMQGVSSHTTNRVGKGEFGTITQENGDRILCKQPRTFNCAGFAPQFFREAFFFLNHLSHSSIQCAPRLYSVDFERQCISMARYSEDVSTCLTRRRTSFRGNRSAFVDYAVEELPIVALEITRAVSNIHTQ